MLKKISVSTILLCIFGNVLVGLGVAIINFGNLGIDPFNGMCMTMAHVLGIAYAPFTLAFNTFLFIFEIIWGRKYILFGTFINWFLVSYVVTFFTWLYHTLGFSDPTTLPARIVFLIVGLPLIGLGLAMYQEADLGVAPYDCIPLMVTDRFKKVQFFAARVTLDALMLVLILAVGNPVHKIGIGTVLTAFCLGPIIQFFTTLLFGKKKKS